MKPEERHLHVIKATRDLSEQHGGIFEAEPGQLEVPLPIADVAGASMIRLSDVKAKPIRWLWPGHIPYGAMTLIIGDPGLGKSQLTLDLAARVTRGTPWPDDAEINVGNVLLLGSEDSIERTVVNRLLASGADLSRVIVMSEVKDKDGKMRMFDLSEDLEVLESAVTSNSIDVIVVDPLNGYLGNTNSWKENEVRKVLAPACAMADRHDVALIGIMHLNKDNTRAAIHRVIGSVAFGAVTRSMFAVAASPQHQALRYFVSVKQNYTSLPPTKAFALVEEGGLAWDGMEYPAINADSLLAITGAPEDKAERRTARQWLAVTLENGPVKTADLVKLAHESAISDKSLQRAKYDLKVVSQRKHVAGKLGGGYWEWRLP